MLKYEIIEVVASELSRLGIKECRMDYIASSLSISKKTIYEYFGSKRNLLYDCVCFCISRNIEQIQSEELDSVSPLRAIARINNILLRQALNFCPAFHNDIRHDVELSKLMDSEYVAYVNECYVKYFEQGRRQGLLDKKITVSHALAFFDQQIRNMYEKTLSDTVTKIDNYSFNILTYLTGVCTDKGRKELEQIRTEVF